jgi:hypothetical protein
MDELSSGRGRGKPSQGEVGPEAENYARVRRGQRESEKKRR